METGLSNNSVICSLQDNLGFMWFGTKDGLNRFDGYSFKTFRRSVSQKGSIGNNFIQSLYEDRDKVLWVGTDKGLYQYLESTEQFRLVRATANMEIMKITRDFQGNFWFISNFKLCKYSGTTGKLECYDRDSFFYATSICTSPDGQIWVGTMTGELKRYDPEKDSFINLDLFKDARPNTPKWIESLHMSSEGYLLAASSNAEIRLVDIHNLTFKSITLNCSEQSNLYMRSIQEITPGEFWVGTESGILAFNVHNGKCRLLKKDYNNPYSISDNAVYTFCRDREGGIWVGTYFGGINYFPHQYFPFQKFFPKKGENSLSGNVVREIKKDRYGNLWIGTEDAGLNRMVPSSDTFYHYKSDGTPGSISFFNIHGLLTTGNELWIGTFNHGLDVMEIPSGKIIRRFRQQPGSDLASEFIYCIYQFSPEEILICTPTGMYTYNRQRDSLKWFDGFPAWNWYTAVLKDSKGTLWASTFGKGVYYFNPQTGQRGSFVYNENEKNGLSSDRVNSIFEDSRQNLWFATEDGLCKFNSSRGKFTRYSAANGFSSDFILSILEDSRQNLWISTTKGLICFTPSTEKIQVYTTANGLLSDQFNYNSAFKDQDGRMYFGSAKGLISFVPEEFKQPTFIPPIYITGFQVNNQEMFIGDKGSPLLKSITYAHTIRLTHDQSTFSLDFAALSYTAPDMIQYSYKMEGLSNTWINLNKNRRVYFMKLPAGTYTFRVNALNGAGGKRSKETRLTIVVLPPWWASNWAKITYGLFSFLLIVFSIRFYHRWMEGKNRQKLQLLEMANEKEILQVQLANEKAILEAKVEFFTNVAHEIRTPLTLIKVPLARIIKKIAGLPDLENSARIMERNTNRLVDLTNQLLDFRQTELNKFHLSIARAEISSLLDEASASFTTLAELKEVIVSLQLPKEPLFAYVDLDAFSKIINNLLSNAVKYSAGKVHIALLPRLPDSRYFTIHVKNDGYLIPIAFKEKIFEPFFRMQETESQTGTGIGLALARSLAQLHNGFLILEKPVDNMNFFSLTLPINQEIHGSSLS